MKIGEIFSVGGCGGRGYGGGYSRPGGYGGSERRYRHGDHYRGSYGGHDGERYDRYDGGGLLGILGGY